MSDEDREIDIESDADDEDGSQAYSSEDKRAHHNALERKRRDHIKDSFHSLRDCVPQDESKGGSSTKTSRAQILRQAAEYIIRMRDKTQQNDRHIDILKKQNDELQSQVRSLQKSQAGGKAVHNSNFFDNDRDDDDSESYEEETVVSSPPTKRKKVKSSS